MAQSEYRRVGSDRESIQTGDSVDSHSVLSDDAIRLLRERSGSWAAADAESRASELEGIQYDHAVSALRGSVQNESAEPLFPVRWRWQWQRALLCTLRRGIGL